MIALRLHNKGDLRLHEEPVPTPGDDEVLVRVTAVGLCGSDLHWYNEGAIGDVGLTQPLVLGRAFTPSECSAPGASPVVVLSHKLWTGAFAADPQRAARAGCPGGRA